MGCGDELTLWTIHFLNCDHRYNSDLTLLNYFESLLVTFTNLGYTFSWARFQCLIFCSLTENLTRFDIPQNFKYYRLVAALQIVLE